MNAAQNVEHTEEGAEGGGVKMSVISREGGALCCVSQRKVPERHNAANRPLLFYVHHRSRPRHHV